MKKIVFIVGSLREKSFNGSLAKLAETALQGKAEIEYIKADAVPFLNNTTIYGEEREERCRKIRAFQGNVSKKCLILSQKWGKI